MVLSLPTGTSFGGSSSGPFEKITVIFVPFSTSLPGSGSCEMTDPSGILSWYCSCETSAINPFSSA